jgi:tetratricopeptide (TPR) repeat protein
VSSFTIANKDLLKDINANIKTTLETELFKLPQNKDSRISKSIEKNILLKNQSKATNSKKDLLSTISNPQKSPSKESYLDPLQTLEDYHNSLANKTSLETPDKLINKNSKKSLALNSKLASSFLQRGNYYKNLGIYSEAIKNFEQAYLLLQKDGHFNEAVTVEAMIRKLRTSPIPD